MKNFNVLLFSLFFVSVLSVNSCMSFSNSGKDYFTAMNYISTKQITKAQKSFEKVLARGNSIEILFSIRELHKICDNQQFLKCCKKAVLSKNDAEIETLNYYAQSLYDNFEYDKVISVCKVMLEKNDLSKTQRQWFNYCLVSSMLKRNEFSMSDEICYNWLLNSSYSEYQDDFVNENIEKLNQENYSLILFRHEVYNKNYNAAFLLLANLKNEYPINSMSAFLLSDIGKVYLYSSNKDYINYANEFEQLANSNDKINSEKAFYAFFYCGRLYEKQGREFFEKAKLSYVKASNNAITDENFDNATWYYLSLLQKESLESFIQGVQETGSTWKDKTYYSDLFEQIFLSLLQKQNWIQYAKFYPIVEKYCEDSIKASFSYVFARLIEEGYIPSSITKEQLYQKVLQNKDAPVYYEVLACERLSKDLLSVEKMKNNITDSNTKNSQNKNDKKFDSQKTDIQKAKNVKQFLYDCLEFGYETRVYYIYSQYREFVSSEILADLSKKLAHRAIHQPNLHPISIRLANAALQKGGIENNLELYQLFYPQYYQSIVTKNSKDYQIEEYLLYALIRSESYFDSTVVSSAGAIGLSQLMESTANDCARKLKLENVDLRNPEQNVLLGSFYLRELINRLDGNVLNSIISYNTGITRVRNWAKQYSNLSADLFIEVLPIRESREYAKKVMSAAAIYGYLYYQNTEHQIINNYLR